MATLKIKDFFGEEVTLQPRLELYSVTDFMGKEMPGLAVVLDQLGRTPEETEQYAVLTVSFGEFIRVLTVSFGEFIRVKNSAYIDTNNCYFAQQILEQGVPLLPALHPVPRRLPRISLLLRPASAADGPSEQTDWPSDIRQRRADGVSGWRNIYSILP